MRALWDKLVASFHDSETIIWSRIQVAIGIIAPVVLTLLHVIFAVDLSPLFTDPRWLCLWLILSGFVGEYLRKHREDWSNADQDDDPNEGGHDARHHS
jgi:hypothetical protein